MHSGLISVLLPKEMELWARGKRDRQRLASLALTTVLGALDQHPVTEERTVAQRVDLLAKFHATRER